jgi:2-keto-4-pentenoate hydratase/2-oxohepta-3-ene-1,7-dioic acid hydratase in catechol pathway
MRLASLAPDGRAALWIGDVLVTLAAAPRLRHAAFAPGTTPRDLLADAAAGSAARALNATLLERDPSDLRALIDAGVAVAADAAALLPPVTPRTIVCAGNNYRRHAAEMNTPLPSRPGGFLKSPAALAAHGEAIVIPPDPDVAAAIDYEGELCVVIGRPAYRVAEADALAYVGGYTIGNDVSARNDVSAMFGWLRDPASTTIEAFSNPQDRVLLGKQYPTFFPLGPCVTTGDEIPDPARLHITTRVDGEIRQDEDTSDLVFTVPQMVAYWSRFYALEPGDVISTGSPSGVALSFTPPRFLRPGSRVAITIAGIGTLANPVAAAG